MEMDCFRQAGWTDFRFCFLLSEQQCDRMYLEPCTCERGWKSIRRGRGKDMILAPGINVKQTPACGRNFEYFSEDPYLIGELAVPLIEGIEESDVSACVKHFALNQQEEERLWVNVEVDERTLREIYLPGFEAAVKKAGVSSLMGAYNLFRGEHCCESEKLLGDILRKEWSYEGVIVSDWGAVHHTKEAALSPLDIEMFVTPDFDSYCLADPLKEKVRSGEIPEQIVDEKVRHILKLMVKLKMITLTEEDGTVKAEPCSERKRGCYNTPEHREAILKIARESIVLLKNENHRLPLSETRAKKVLVIGQNAVTKHALGGGSAEIKALYEITPLLGISMFLGGNAKVDYLPGYEIPKKEESEHNWQEDSLKGKGEAFCTVSVKVKNTGTMAGMETVQLYLGEKEVRAENPVKELKAFEKVALEPGESKEVRFILDQSAFAHYDGNEGRFVTKTGTYTLYLGTSSQNILAEQNVEIRG